MSINLTSPTCFTTAVLIGDTVINNLGVPETIPEMTTVINPTTGLKETSNSALEIKSQLGGLLLPRMTTEQINNLDYRIKVEGMEIYNVSIPCVQIYQNGSWVNVATISPAGPAYAPGSPLYLYKSDDETSIGILPNIYPNFGPITPNNLFIGSIPLGVITGNDNIVIGYQAALNADPNQSVIIGSQAAQHIAIDTTITAVGYQALRNSTIDGNTAVGWRSGFQTNAGGSNVFIGDSAGGNNTTGGSNVMVGFNAGQLHTAYDHSVFVGWQADATTPGLEYLTCVGYGTKGGAGGTALGAGANALGTNSIAIGNNDGAGVTTTFGTSCIAIGTSCNSGNIGDNTQINSIALGNAAVATSTNAIAIGNAAAAPAVNSIAIGAGTSCTVPNAMNLGNSALVGINNPTPAWALDIGVVNNATTTNVTGIQLASTAANVTPIPASPGCGAIFVGIDGNLYFQSSSLGIGNNGLFILSFNAAP